MSFFLPFYLYFKDYLIVHVHTPEYLFGKNLYSLCPFDLRATSYTIFPSTVHMAIIRPISFYKLHNAIPRLMKTGMMFTQRHERFYSKDIWRIFAHRFWRISPHTVKGFPVLLAPYSKTRRIGLNTITIRTTPPSYITLCGVLVGEVSGVQHPGGPVRGRDHHPPGPGVPVPCLHGQLRPSLWRHGLGGFPSLSRVHRQLRHLGAGEERYPQVEWLTDTTLWIIKGISQRD